MRIDGEKGLKVHRSRLKGLQFRKFRSGKQRFFQLQPDKYQYIFYSQSRTRDFNFRNQNFLTDIVDFFPSSSCSSTKYLVFNIVKSYNKGSKFRICFVKCNNKDPQLRCSIAKLIKLYPERWIIAALFYNKGSKRRCTFAFLINKGSEQHSFIARFCKRDPKLHVSIEKWYKSGPALRSTIVPFYNTTSELRSTVAGFCNGKIEENMDVSTLKRSSSVILCEAKNLISL